MEKKHSDLWETSASSEAGLRPGNAFTNRILDRVRRQTTVYDYVYMFVQGFFEIAVGLLRGISADKNNSQSREH